MLKLVAVLFVSVALACAHGAVECEERIVGGGSATIEEHPYQVSLQFLGHHICGGSILSAHYVLTASHCVDGFAVQYLSVRAGSKFHASCGQVAKVSRVYMHQDYSASTVDYDIAVLEFGDPIVKGGPVTLPSRPYTNGECATVTGWGALSTNGPVPSVLNEVDVNIITAASCSPYYPGKITARMLCAASNGADSCQGDSGGPLVVDGVLVGVVSWGYGCADPYHPGVYADVYYLKSWILNVMGL